MPEDQKQILKDAAYKAVYRIASRPVDNRIVLKEECYTVIACADCGKLLGFYPDPTKLTPNHIEQLLMTLPCCRCDEAE